jgi:hypothetical protein
VSSLSPSEVDSAGFSVEDREEPSVDFIETQENKN